MHAQSSPAAQHRRGIRWLPDQKGAWVMVVVPFLSGAVGGGFTWQHIPLFALWISSYALFYVLGVWISSQRQLRFRPPVIAWGSIGTSLGVLNLWLCGALVPWTLLFIPLVSLALWAILHHRNRTLLARSIEVITAGLMCLVAWDAGTRIHGPFGSVVSDLGIVPIASITLADLPRWGVIPTLLLTPYALKAVAVTVALTYYFWSTIPFVKSLVRERSSHAYAVLAKSAQWVGLAAAVIAWACKVFDWRMPLMWGILLIRWAYFSRVAHPQHGEKVNARQLLITVGIVETMLSILYMGAALA